MKPPANQDRAPTKALRSQKPSHLPSLPITLIAGTLILLAGSPWISGAMGIIMPVRVLWPFLMIGLGIAVLVAALAEMGLAISGRRSARGALVGLAVLGISAVCLVVAPSQRDGFEWRVARIAEADWIRLADDARRTKSDANADGTPKSSAGSGRVKRLPPELGQGHAHLNLRFDSPRLYISDTRVTLDWGSGLMGGPE